MRRPAWTVCAVAMSIVTASSACSSKEDATDAGTDEPSGGEDAPSKVQSPECTAYLDCVLDVAPSTYGPLAESYGEGGSCWSAGTPEKCTAACDKARAELARVYPKSEQCSALPRGEDSAPGEDSEPADGLYYGACLTELAFGNPAKVFNFYTRTKYTAAASNASLEMSLQALRLESGSTPASVDSSAIVGASYKDTSDVGVDARFSLELGEVTIAATANPINGTDVVIEGATLQGRFGTSRFCARLGGRIAKPKAAERDLDPSNNICRFVSVKDGDPTPALTFADFQPESCPLD